MPDRAARLACATLLVIVLVVSPGTFAAPASAQTTNSIAGTQIAPDDVSMQIALTESGTAEWTIEYRVRLDDESTTEAFESLQSDIAANESQYTSQFRDRMVGTADTAENTTGREMTIENVSVTATRQQLPQDYGVLTYTFTWTNFAVAEGDELRAGDALAGLFLDEETSLQISWPDGYALDTAQPDPDDTRLGSGIVVWNGPLDFGPNEPLIVATAAPAGGEATTTAAADGGAGDAGADDAGGDDGSNLMTLGAVALLIALAGVGGWVLYQRRGSTDGPSNAPSAGPVSGAGSTPAGEAQEGTDAEATGDADGDTEPSTATPEPEETGPAATAAAEPEDDAPPWEDDLLSNEERVLAVVEHEGGRIKQQEVAKTLDWTDAKTSQVIRKMRDDDQLDAFRLGRENVLVLPGESIEPDKAGDDDE